MTVIAPALAAKYDNVLQCEFVADQSRHCLPFAMDKVRAAAGAEADKKRFYAAVAGLTDAELEGFGAYRRANKWWNFG